jgi:hypothetical protein
MIATITKIIGPYNGRHDKNIITYKLKLADKKVIAWHEIKGRGFPSNLKKGDMVKGLVLNTKRMIPDYKNSEISEFVFSQIELWR